MLCIPSLFFHHCVLGVWDTVSDSFTDCQSLVATYEELISLTSLGLGVCESCTAFSQNNFCNCSPLPTPRKKGGQAKCYFSNMHVRRVSVHVEFLAHGTSRGCWEMDCGVASSDMPLSSTPCPSLVKQHKINI